MKVLVIGSGGREHAICNSFAGSTKVTKLYCADGNAGISQIAECVSIKADDIERLAAFAQVEAIDLTFVGGETPLSLGIVDEFGRRGLRIIGPTQQAARLESSKSFAKEFMLRHSVPTARFVTAASPSAGIAELESGVFGNSEAPVVVKADGLAAGKGVIIAANRSEAVDAIDGLSELVGEAAAGKIVIEECLVGREVSVLMFVDGEDFALMPATRDHKRIGENDTGPNTGGMGAVTDASLLSKAEVEKIVDEIIRPTLKGCIAEGFPFRGVLFLGLMMVGDQDDRQPMLLEYNVRFGDPETQAILIRLKTDLMEICDAMLTGSLQGLTIDWATGSSACVVLASRGYPAKPETGDVIDGLGEAAELGVQIFHAGTTLAVSRGDNGGMGRGQTRTAGGRVLGITAAGDDLSTALNTAYEAAGRIRFAGMQFRRDIGR